MDFLKTNPKPAVKAIIFEGQFFDAKQTEKISKLPGREDVLAQLVGNLNAPLYGLVNSLQGIVRNFVYALQAVAEKKEKAAQ